MAATEALMAEEGMSGQAVFVKNGEKVSFELESKTYCRKLYLQYLYTFLTFKSIYNYMYIVMDLPVSTVSLNHSWFRDGESAVFITAKSDTAAFNNPNFYDFNGDNSTKYLGYPTAANPVLNWQNDKVRITVFDAVKKFLLLGIDGFHIDHISRLAVDLEGVPDHDKAISILKELTSTIKKFIASHEVLQNKKIVLFSSLRDIEDLHVKAKETGDLHYIIDNSFASLSNEKCYNGISKCVHEALTNAYLRYQENSYTPYWQFSNPDSSRLASRFDADTANLLTFMQLTLPGALSLYYGQELGLSDVGNPSTQRGIMQWNPSGSDHHGFLSKSDENLGKLFFAESDDIKEEDNFENQFALEKSPLKVYQKLAKMRQRDESLIVGSTVRDAVDGDVIIYSRFVKGKNATSVGSVFIVALNYGTNEVKVDFSEHNTSEILPVNKKLSNAEIAAVTPGVHEYRILLKL
uniref:Aamy domain-containing protein n=1 Tax=Heterorhabditis bacteriophora TaxID=37862 RepID=A0A1I7WIM6_HETBA